MVFTDIEVEFLSKELNLIFSPNVVIDLTEEQATYIYEKCAWIEINETVRGELPERVRMAIRFVNKFCIINP